MPEQKRSDPSRLSAVSELVQPARFTLDSDICTLGRSSVCDIVVDVETVSRVHAKIERDLVRYVLHDTNSANGTYVNGRRLVAPYVLQDQDLIGFSGAEPLLCFEDSDPTIQLSTGRLRYDPKVMMFFYNFRKLELTPSEFKLLRVLYQNAGQVCSREQCAEAIWEHGYEPDPDNDPLNRVVSNLRQKLKQVDPESDLIETHRGVGYILHL